MHGIAAVVMATALAGCSSAAPAKAPPSAPPPSAGPSPSASPSPTRPAFPSAADGSNIKACYDGKCEVLVAKKARIPLKPSLRVSGLVVTVSGGRVKMVAGGGSMQADGNANTTLAMNGVVVYVVAVEDSRAVLKFGA
jgi:hypothetical protein